MEEEGENNQKMGEKEEKEKDRKVAGGESKVDKREEAPRAMGRHHPESTVKRMKTKHQNPLTCTTSSARHQRRQHSGSGGRTCSDREERQRGREGERERGKEKTASVQQRDCCSQSARLTC